MIFSYTVESLPKKPLARIDYVLITVDMTQLHSLTILKALTQHMKDRFLTNKMAVVVTKSKYHFFFSFHKIHTKLLRKKEKKKHSKDFFSTPEASREKI